MTIEENIKALHDLTLNICAYYCGREPMQCPNCDFCREREALLGAEAALKNRRYMVRCSDCKYWKFDYPGCTYSVRRCSLSNWMMDENGYCSRAEEVEAE